MTAPRKWRPAPLVVCPNCAQLMLAPSHMRRAVGTETVCRLCGATLTCEGVKSVKLWKFAVKP